MPEQLFGVPVQSSKMGGLQCRSAAVLRIGAACGVSGNIAAGESRWMRRRVWVVGANGGATDGQVAWDVCPSTSAAVRLSDLKIDAAED